MYVKYLKYLKLEVLKNAGFLYQLICKQSFPLNINNDHCY